MMNAMPVMERHLHNLGQFDYHHAQQHQQQQQHQRYHPSSMMYGPPSRAPPPGNLIMPNPIQFSPSPHQHGHTHHHNLHHQQAQHVHHQQQAQLQQHQQQEQHAALINSSPKQQQQQQHLMPTPTSELGNQFDEQPPTNLEGFPTASEFENLLNEYILSLSPKKRDKALIPQKRYENIRAVLRDPKCTTIESAQFRFWAKKMFRLVADDGYNDVVCHEGKPVAVREELYNVLTSSHGQAQHGGRDKTSAQVRKHYSWVPKELIARFVRNCPSCTLRRSSPLEFSAASNRASQTTTEANPASSPYLNSPSSTSGSPTQRHAMSTPSNVTGSALAQLQAQMSPLPLVTTPGDQGSYTQYGFPPNVNLSLDPRMYGSQPGPNELGN